MTTEELTEGDAFAFTDKELYFIIDNITSVTKEQVNVRISQYTDLPFKAHTSAGHTDTYDSHRTITAGDIFEQLESGEIEPLV